jgi:hypothetical protein
MRIGIEGLKSLKLELSDIPEESPMEPVSDLVDYYLSEVSLRRCRKCTF